MGAVCMAVFGPAVMYVVVAEFTDFTWAWLGMVGINLFTVLALTFGFPETLQEIDAGLEQRSILQICIQELQGFRSLITTNPVIKYRLMQSFVEGLGNAACVHLPFAMAHFGFSMVEAFGTGLPAFATGAMFMPLIPALCKKCGYRPVFIACFCYTKLLDVAQTYFCLSTFHGAPAASWLAIVGSVLSGWGASVWPAVEIRLVGQENNAKYQAMAQLAAFVCGSVSSFVYLDLLFNPKASTFFGKTVQYWVGLAVQ